jgi:hypothetical protein
MDQLVYIDFDGSRSALASGQIAAMAIALERLLHGQRRRAEPLAHVGAAGRQQHPRAAKPPRKSRVKSPGRAALPVTIDRRIVIAVSVRDG